jgi:curli biogenesis system outer membrane secretion channel CsgG
MTLPGYSEKGVSVIGMFFVFAAFFCLASCTSVPVDNNRSAGLAVWDIEDVSIGGSGGNVGELLSAQVTEVLQRKGAYTVIERTRLLRVLEELRLGSSTLADEQTRLRVGKLVGARFMVFGGYQVVGDQMRIDLRMVEVETGKIRKAVQKTTQSSGLTAWMEAARLAGAEL